MYNLAQHYENIYTFLKTIITDPRVAYLHPFGSTQPENVEIIRDDAFEVGPHDPTRAQRGPLFIFYDQEPLNYVYNRDLFQYIKDNTQGPYVLVNTEHTSAEKDRICDEFAFAHLDYFFHIFAAADWYRGHEYIPNLVEPGQRQLKKTYITFNRLTSGERIYRSLFINELYKANLLDSGYVSYSKTCPGGGSYDENLRAGIANQRISPVLVEEAIANISQLPELRIDFKDQDYIPNSSMVLNPIPELMESFIFVVTETCYWQQKTHLTEKIFKPIVLRMPFLLVGCPNNLEYLRSYGFKTFGDYWDESYDSELDPIRRMQMVTQILKDINELPVNEQQDMLRSMSHILEHNYNLFNDPKFVMQEWNHLKQELINMSKLYEFKPPFTYDMRLGQAIPIDPT